MFSFYIKRYFYIIFYRIFSFIAPQEGENIILERIFAKKSKGFYIDVGAHHPIRFSNTLSLYNRGWSGINIEPNNEVINSFKKLRPRDLNLNMAVSHEKNSKDYYLFEDPALNTMDSRIKNLRINQGFKLIKKFNKVSK